MQSIMGNNQLSPNDNIRPRFPFILYIIEAGFKCNKNTYFNSQTTGNNVLIELQAKWSEKLNDEIRLDTLCQILLRMQKSTLLQYTNILFNTSNSIGEKYITHYYTKDISITPNCLFCNDLETIEHVYMECPKVIHISKSQIQRRLLVRNTITISNTSLSLVIKM